jgi:DNA primase
MAGMIPPEIVDQVRHASDIVDVVGGYVPLKKAGAKFKALSPFNKEKTPSFYVDPARQIFKCFSSGHGGDVFKFLMLMENLTFPEAIRRLAQRASIVVPETGVSSDPQARSRREELHALYAAVATHWHKLLKSDPAAEAARAYLKSRDFPESLTDEFGLGFAPDGWDTTLNWARKNGYSPEALETGRLVATSESGRTYDFFRNRLMIPIHNDAGEVVAFSGRLLDPEVKAQKYVNSPETPIFVKSRILFGLNKTKRPIIEVGSAILCEGQIDLMRCWQHGIRNVVAPQGTAFTDPHARILKRIAKEVVICFDADRAGQNAAQRTIDVLLKEDLQVRIARIPQGEDPDSLLRKKPVAFFEDILHDAKDHTRHLLDVACEQEDITSPRGRGLVAASMAQRIARIPNAVQRETFLLEVARRLEVPRAALEEEVRKAEAQIRRTELQQRDYPSPPQASSMEASSTSPASAEPLPPIEAAPVIEAILTVLLTNPELAPQVSRALDNKWVEGRAGHEVLLQLLEAHAHDAFESAEQFMGECDERTRDFVAGLLIEKDSTKTFFQAPGRPLSEREKKAAGEFEKEQKGSPEDLVRSFLSLLEKDWKRQRLQYLTLSVKSPELSVEERLKYLTEIESIRRQFPDLKP